MRWLILLCLVPCVAQAKDLRAEKEAYLPGCLVEPISPSARFPAVEVLQCRPLRVGHVSGICSKLTESI
jgi:hypothetical protein